MRKDPNKYTIRGSLVTADGAYADTEVMLPVIFGSQGQGIIIDSIEVEEPRLDADADDSIWGLSKVDGAADQHIDDEDVVVRSEKYNAGAHAAGVAHVDAMTKKYCNTPIFQNKIWFFAIQGTGAAHTYRFRITYQVAYFTNQEILGFAKNRALA